MCYTTVTVWRKCRVNMHCDCMKGMESEHVLHYCYCMKGMSSEHAL